MIGIESASVGLKPFMNLTPSVPLSVAPPTINRLVFAAAPSETLIVPELLKPRFEAIVVAPSVLIFSIVPVLVTEPP